MAPDAPTAPRPPEFHAHADVEDWADAAAATIDVALRRDLAAAARTRLLLSGGTTPSPVYAQLAERALDWSRVDVALVDERWLLPDDPDSNARLVREHLLRGSAAGARFEALTSPGRDIESALAVANAHARQPASVAVLGMGDDGHTASLFPGSAGLPRALASDQPYVAVDASDAPGARGWARRITLTPAGLRYARDRLLLIRGAGKRALFERACADGDPRRWPVLVGLAGSTPLQVHWCP